MAAAVAAIKRGSAGSRELALGDGLAGKLLLLRLGFCQAGGAKLAAPQHLAQLVVAGHILQDSEGQDSTQGRFALQEGPERVEGRGRPAGVVGRGSTPGGAHGAHRQRLAQHGFGCDALLARAGGSDGRSLQGTAKAASGLFVRNKKRSQWAAARLASLI